MNIAPVLPFHGGYTNKPPAFQFYAKDWLSSPTRHKMTRAERGLFMDMLAIAWDSDPPGTVTISLQDFAKLLGIFPKVLRKFLAKFPKTFIKFDKGFRQVKLNDQWQELLQNSQKKRDAANLRWVQNDASALHVQCPAPAPSSAPSSASAPELQTQDPVRETEFQSFWRAYPKKVNEKQAFRAWCSTPGIHNHIEEILTVIMQYEISGMWDDPIRIPNPENFIRDKRWRDEVPKRAGTKGDQRVERAREVAREVAREYGIEGHDISLGDNPKPALQSGPVERRGKNIH